MININCGKILLIAPEFFGYELEIRAELEHRGASVDFIIDRPIKSSLFIVFTKYFPKITQFFLNLYYRKKINNLKKNSYNIVLVINGQTISPNILIRLRESLVGARFILYIWDSLKNRPSIINNLKFFENVYTFDPDDAIYFKLRYLPLFFSKAYEAEPIRETCHQITFIGTAHTDRFLVLNKLKDNLPDGVTLYKYLYLRSSILYWGQKIKNISMRDSKLTDFYFTPMVKKEVLYKIFRSFAILDIEHPNQKGLTIRTLEALGAKRKLITTNNDIKNYDFYNPNNIHVIDRNDPRINIEFFMKSYEDIPSKLYKKYSIQGWVNRLLS